MDVSRLFDVLRQAPAVHEKFNVEKVDVGSHHLFRDILPANKCTFPYYLVSQQCAEESIVSDSGDGNESVSGSPLALKQFDAPNTLLNEKEQVYSPVSVNDARRIISNYTLGLQEGEELKERLPMWVLCNSTESMTIALGVEINEDDTISTWTATVKGPIEKPPKFPNIDDIVKIYGDATTHCKASYNVFKQDAGSVAENGVQGSLKINLEWSKFTGLLQMPPPDATCHIQAVVGMGDICSQAHFMFQELSIVKRLAEGIQNNNMQWEMQDKEGEIGSIQKQVHEIINNAELQNIATSRNKPVKEEAVTSPFKNVYLVRRKNLDFTEQLWDILKHCDSYQDLHDALATVLASLQRGSYQPMLHRANKTQLANLIRDSFHKKMVVPELNGLLPLQLLLEIGIEKIARDFSNQMVSKELVTAADLDFFVARDISTMEQCERLQGLQTVLELVVMLEHNLSVPADILRPAARKALSQEKEFSTQAKEVRKELVPSFSIPMSVRRLSSQLSQLQPAMWTLWIQTAGVHCVYHLAHNCPLQHAKSPGFSKPERTAGKEEGNPFYLLTTVRETKI